MPVGGVIILGLQEKTRFAATGVYDSIDAKKRLAAQLRDAVDPPLTGEFSNASVDGKEIVIVRVNELNTARKPCVVRANGRAYLRSYDGDYPLSEQECAAFVAERATLDTTGIKQTVIEPGSIIPRTTAFPTSWLSFVRDPLWP